MRLGDMNNLKAKALNEDMQKRVGWNFGDLDRLSIVQASAMLENVDSKLSAFKKTKKLHESEKDTVYNGLVMAKRVLESYIAERAVSKAQQKAAGAALAAKRGDAPKSELKGASKAMAKMSKAELEKVAGTKHKGLPEKKKVAEGYGVFKSGGSVGEKNTGKPVKKFDSKEAAANHAKGLNSQLSKGEKKDYKLKYTVKKINESYDARLEEAYSHAEEVVDQAFHGMFGTVENLISKTDKAGKLARMIARIGGDAAWLNDANLALENAYSALEAAHQGALGGADVDESQGMFEDEVGQAETIMAAQDMVDSIQGMLEDVGQMINEKLPPLTDSIRRSNGAEAAATFNQQTSAALNALMDAVRTARESMGTAVGTLSGEAPAPMTSVDPAAGGDVDLDVDVDADIGGDEGFDDFGASDAATGGEEPLGRAKRA